MAALAILLLAAMVVGVAPAAQAKIDIVEFDGEVYDVDDGGSPVAATQAGSHPDGATMRFEVGSELIDNPVSPLLPDVPRPLENIKNTVVELPAGLLGNPQAMPKCTDYQLTQQRCPIASQVGWANVELMGNGLVANIVSSGVFNMVPSTPSSPARFAINVFVSGPIYFDASVRSDGDYGVNIEASEASQLLAPLAVEVTLWGVPADPLNDADRGDGCWLDSDPQCANAVSVSRVPLITLPTSCVGPVETRMTIDSWQNPGSTDPANWETASFLSHEPGDRNALIGVDGCENVPFEPTFDVAPHSREPGEPSGYTVDLRVPQPMNPTGIESAHLRKAVVTMPRGVRMNPSAADGLAGCSDEQIGIGSKADETCPDGSKIGTVVVHTPVLEDPLEGNVYLGTQTSLERYRIFIVVKYRGVIVKLKGVVTPDPETGQLTATFDNNPQLPFDHMRVQFKGGPRAPLVNPDDCGTHALTSVMTPWSGTAPATPSASFQIDCPGDAGGFDPGFEAGSLEPIAGTFSPFVARITRDGGKDLGRVNMILPRGSLADLSDVAVCTNAQLATSETKTGRQTQSSPACPVESQVGRVVVGAGAGPNPYYPMIPGTNATGRVFLTEKHANTQFNVPGMPQAAYGLAIEVPAVAGPFDLGTVLVRAAIYVDPATAQIRVLSDTMPRILEGVPLNVRDIRVHVDRPDFTTTPTSCKASRVTGDLRAQDNTVALKHSSYRVADCDSLREYNPRLALRLVGKRQRNIGQHPAVRAVVRQTGVGESGVRRARVVLPDSVALDPDNAQALCEFEDGTKPDIENHCPDGSIVGRARAKSPLLKRDLVGNVYFVKNIRRDPKTGNEIRTLPMIIVALRGEVAVNLRGKSSTTKNGRLVNTFPGVPDAPISRFNLNIKGGANGILAVTRTRAGKTNLCATRRQIANARWIGHSGERRSYRLRVKTPCGKRKRAAAGQRKGSGAQRNSQARKK